MGLFDYRCMISGLSLSSSRTILILLEKSGNAYIPISLPVIGQYNRLGTIDMVLEDENTSKILNFFQSKISSGEAIVNWTDVYFEGEFLSKIESIEQLFAAIERGVTMEYDCVTIKGSRIVYCLIDYYIWNEVTLFKSENRAADAMHSDTWDELYQEPIPFQGNWNLEFRNLQDFLNVHNIPWSIPTDPSQYGEHEEMEFRAQARQKFSNEPLVLAGILAHEKALNDTLY